MVVSKGKGVGNSNMIQTLGRGTGNNREVLKANGHTGVQLLAPEGDIDAANKQDDFQKRIIRNKEQGETFEDTMTGTVHPDDFNLIRHNDR